MFGVPQCRARLYFVMIRMDPGEINNGEARLDRKGSFVLSHLDSVSVRHPSFEIRIELQNESSRES